MNSLNNLSIMHLRYAAEVAKRGSIRQAAEALYMGQPNLSKAIRELESTVGIQIFERSPKGVQVTEKGKEFLEFARSILDQLAELEKLYTPREREVPKLNISVPRASYIAYAFTNFINKLPPDRIYEMDFRETNSMQAIDNILDSHYNLGIIRYGVKYAENFRQLLAEKNLESKLIWEYRYVILCARNSPLAQCEKITHKVLADYIEVAHGDLTTPNSRQRTPERPAEKIENSKIYVYERGSQFDLLSRSKRTYMWVSPVTQEQLDRYGLVQKKCAEETALYQDVVIFPKGYKFNELDMLFFNEVFSVKEKLSKLYE